MMKIINEVVEELFKETYDLFEQMNCFIQYVEGQRQKRYHVRTEVDSVLRCVEYLTNTGGSDEWMNVP